MVAGHWGWGTVATVSRQWHRSIIGRIWSSRREFLEAVHADRREDLLMGTIAHAGLAKRDGIFMRRLLPLLLMCIRMAHRMMRRMLPQWHIG